MKKILLVLFLLSTSPCFAEYSYVSPETYAVNEADMLDYMNIPATPKPRIEDLDKKKTVDILTSNKSHKEKKVTEKKPYEKTLTYKAAKWWVDQRYKREEVHHGTKHEIKVKAREQYEKQLEEKK